MELKLNVILIGCKMNREEFMTILKNHSEKSGLFGNRFRPLNENNNLWSYHRPGIVLNEPTIDVSNKEYVVFNSNTGFSNKTETFSYDEFSIKYNLY